MGGFSSLGINLPLLVAFLINFAVLFILLKIFLYKPILKMLDDKERSCPFVTPEGCTIYTDRPANCRYYPVGQGALMIADRPAMRMSGSEVVSVCAHNMPQKPTTRRMARSHREK